MACANTVKMLSTSSGPSWHVGVFSAFRAEAVAIDQLSLLVTEAPLLLVVREGGPTPWLASSKMVLLGNAVGGRRTRSLFRYSSSAKPLLGPGELLWIHTLS